MKVAYAALLGVLLFAASSQAADWYVSPAGQAANAGTKDAPWDIVSALNGSHRVMPGDTIYLLAGTYKPADRKKPDYQVRLVGEEDKPIQISAPPGEHVIIDAAVSFKVGCKYVWIRDMELTISEPMTESQQPGSWPTDLNRPSGGLDLIGVEVRAINLVIHNCMEGIGFMNVDDTPGGEIYGCLIYDNGWQAPDRHHGHCMYVQNKYGTKLIANNIMSVPQDGGGSCTVHVFATKGYANSCIVEDNIAYSVGPFLVGTYDRAMERDIVRRNYLYGVDMWAGYPWAKIEAADCEFSDNYVVNGVIAQKMLGNSKVANNTVIPKETKATDRPKEPKIVLLPNKYDAKRASLAIYNFAQAPTVSVSFAPFMKAGDAFRLMDPKNFYGEPVFKGTVGADGAAEIPVKGEFGVFVVIHE